MVTFAPAYRLTAYAPRSAGGAETTALVPRAGSPHAEPFQVASIQGLTGYRPYLDTIRGRRGEVDPLEKKTDTGELVVRLLDKRIGTGNLKRWLTAYLGDALGANVLLGRKVIIEESLDGGATWTRFFTGRVSSARLDGKLYYELAIRDMADDLDVDVFTSAPAAAATHPSWHASKAGQTYSHLAQVWPLGLLRPYGDFPVTIRARGTIRYTTPSFPYVIATPYIEVSRSTRTVTTKALADALGREDQYLVRITPAAGGAETVHTMGTPPLYGTNFGDLTSPTAIWLRWLDGAIPPAGTVVDFDIAKRGGPAPEMPLLIDDVHPVTLWRHLLQGYYAIDTHGAPHWSLDYDAAAFEALERDTSFPPVRFIMPERARLNEWVEECICKPNHLAYHLDAFGRVVPIDLRRKSNLGTLPTLTDADLEEAADQLRWEQGRDGALTGVEVRYVAERWIRDEDLPKPFAARGDEPYPDIPTIRIEEIDYTLILEDFGPRSQDVKRRTLKVEALGLRFRYALDEATGETFQGVPRRRFVEDHLAGFAGDLKAPFGVGANYVELACTRTATVKAMQVGRYVVLSLSALPDPATNQRGGPRLAICVGKSEDGPRVALRFLDAGYNAVCVPPVFGTVGQNQADPAGAVDIVLTPNAAGDEAVLQYCVTATSVGTRPAAGDPGWITAATLTGNTAQTVTIPHLPSGRRAWLRARSVARAGGSFKLPSAWVFPATTRVDTASLPTPTGLAVTVGGSTSAVVTWTAGSYQAELYVARGSTTPAGGWSRDHLVGVVPAGSSRANIFELEGPSLGHIAAIRYVDGRGGASAYATRTFTTGLVPAVCPRPAGLEV